VRSNGSVARKSAEDAESSGSSLIRKVPRFWAHQKGEAASCMCQGGTSTSSACPVCMVVLGAAHMCHVYIHIPYDERSQL